LLVLGNVVLGNVACGSAAATEVKTPAATPPTHAAKTVKAKERPATERPTHFASLFNSKDSEPTGELPPGILITDNRNRDRQTPVRPAAMDLSSLPLGAIPKPLDQKDAPKVLPANRGSRDLKTEAIESGSRSRSAAVYVVLDAKMGRLQIGTVSHELAASDRVYRTCGEKFYTRPFLTPARWETLTVNAKGVAEYRIVDAWFDAQTCETSTVRTTVIRPKPVLGGLMYAFQNNCEDCFPRKAVTFLTPTLTQLAATGVGGKAYATHGTHFSIVSLPIQRGGAASFTGTAAAHSLKPWLEALKQTAPNADATMGAEITQAVPDVMPSAITYATFIKR
jgi:hypothetical protein